MWVSNLLPRRVSILEMNAKPAIFMSLVRGAIHRYPNSSCVRCALEKQLVLPVARFLRVLGNACVCENLLFYCVCEHKVAVLVLSDALALAPA